MPEPIPKPKRYNWRILDVIETANVGDIIHTGNINSNVAWAANCYSSFPGYFWDFNDSKWVRGIGCTVDGLAGTLVYKLKQTHASDYGCSIYVMRRHEPVTPEEWADRQSEPSDLRYYSPNSPCGDTYAPPPAKKSRFRMNPIFSKPHPFFSRESEPKMTSIPPIGPAKKKSVLNWDDFDGEE